MSFSQKLGHLPRTSASRYFWWLAFVDQPKNYCSRMFTYGLHDLNVVFKSTILLYKNAFLCLIFVPSLPVTLMHTQEINVIEITIIINY